MHLVACLCLSICPLPLSWLSENAHCEDYHYQSKEFICMPVISWLMLIITQTQAIDIFEIFAHLGFVCLFVSLQSICHDVLCHVVLLAPDYGSEVLRGDPGCSRRH